MIIGRYRKFQNTSFCPGKSLHDFTLWIDDGGDACIGRTYHPFASFNGPDFYGRPRNTGTVTLRRETWTPPESFRFGEAELKPLRSGETMAWRLQA